MTGDRELSIAMPFSVEITYHPPDKPPAVP
jgi:hypothetical protein